MNEPLTLRLPIELDNGNAGRGSRWFRSSNVRKKIEKVLRQLGLAREPYDVPVSLTITRIVGKGQRLWDADSIGRGNAKELVDALVAVGFFHDDGPKFIKLVDYRQRVERGSLPEVEITIEVIPAGERQMRWLKSPDGPGKWWAWREGCEPMLDTITERSVGKSFSGVWWQRVLGPSGVNRDCPPAITEIPCPP